MMADLASLERPRAAPVARPTVSVIVTTYNHANFLSDAIASILAQDQRPDEIIVVDDGSEDDPEAVIRAFPGIRFIRQENRGLATARNTGLMAATSDLVVFLDADDRLLPNAISAGVRCLASAPESGLVYGGHRRIDADGTPLGADRYDAIGPDPYSALLCGNVIGMHATVLYRRDRLFDVGAFDTSLPRCEDYDLFLRMARLYPIASHAAIVAEYRWHGGNASGAHREMLRWVLKVHGKQRALMTTPAARKTWRRGRRIWRDYYAEQILEAARHAHRGDGPPAVSISRIAGAALVAPRLVAKEAVRTLRHRMRHSRRRTQPKPGAVRLGDLDRLEPIDGDFGFGRGTPIDRYYIESFLARNAADIFGRVLEIGDNAYTLRFGGTRVTRSDVLHVRDDVPGVTIVGNLAVATSLPPDTFDCLVITQTLHLIYDMRAAVRAMHRALKPGGAALVTVPGISPIDRGEWKSDWYWSLTPVSARRLFGEAFGDDAVTIESHGNVFAAIVFLEGLALEEIDRRKLDVVDEAYPVAVTIRARKPI
jgi:glycosyltransferase involved in cell wall biosynthesis